MFGLGTLINTGAVIAGGLIGMTLKKGIPESCREVLMEACGVSTIFIGIGGVLSKMLVIHNGTLETQGTMLLIFSLILGSLAGSLLNIEMKLEEFGEFLKKKFHTEGDSLFVEGFVTCTLVICIGAMAIVGSIEDGLYRKRFYPDCESHAGLCHCSGFCLHPRQGCCFFCFAIILISGKYYSYRRPVRQLYEHRTG